MSSYEIISSGDAADIFALGEDKVVKVYKRQICRPSVEYSLDDYDAYISALCRAEIYSYKKIQPYENLRIHTPVFYGIVDPFEVFPSLKSLKRGYIKGCGIVLECIKGNDVKIGNLSVTEQGEVEIVLDRIRELNGGLYGWDASCFPATPAREFKLIDFSDWVDESYGKVLYSQGCFSKNLRSVLDEEFRT